MLKKKALRKIFITTVFIFIVLIIYTLTSMEDDTKIYSNVKNMNNGEESIIYTLNNDDYICKTTVYVDNNQKIEDKVKNILEIMTKDNNKNALLPSNFKPILPKNTEVISVELDNDILKINFTKELLNIDKDQSNKMIEAIIYTMTDIDSILGIEIYADSKLLQYVPNTNNKLPTILTRDFGINKVYDITNNNDIKKVNLYYYAKSDNDFYVVPVTKYLNDDREKIEIIIDELTNNYIYSKNLVSFLNNNFALSKYQIDKDNIILIFNNNIDNEDKRGIEALLNSIFDNYDIQKIEIMIGNEKISEKIKENH